MIFFIRETIHHNERHQTTSLTPTRAHVASCVYRIFFILFCCILLFDFSRALIHFYLFFCFFNCFAAAAFSSDALFKNFNHFLIMLIFVVIFTFFDLLLGDTIMNHSMYLTFVVDDIVLLLMCGMMILCLKRVD